MSHTYASYDVEEFFSYKIAQGCSSRFMSMLGIKNIHEYNTKDEDSN